ncbi:MAG: 50S ribosomal protein L7/L12 [Clostridiales bacterium]|nr:MAG: 50S ribosomal protein L7/L12 [Clostridiales bacterium]
MANEKTQQIIDLVKTLSILELNDLVKAMEEEFGVSAAPVAVAAAPGAAAAAPAAEEKTEFDVELTSFEEAKKLKVIKEVKDVTGLSLGEAKDLVVGAPKPIKTGVSKEEAEAIKAQIEAAGAVVTIK